MSNECNTRPTAALPMTSRPLTTSATPWPSGWTRAGSHITQATAATPLPPTQTVCGHHGNGHTHWNQPPPLTFYNLYQHTSSTQSKDAKDPLRKRKRKPGHRRGTPAPPESPPPSTAQLVATSPHGRPEALAFPRPPSRVPRDDGWRGQSPRPGLHQQTRPHLRKTLGASAKQTPQQSPLPHHAAAESWRLLDHRTTATLRWQASQAQASH